MKETIATILQQKMDKCTTEQFWATGAITGLNAFLISQTAPITALISNWAVVVASLFLALYGIYFVIHRHISYFVLHKELAELLKDEPIVPASIKIKPNKWKGHNLSGIVFFVVWIALGTSGVVFSYLC
ncbi:MAG: hypothetical protein JSW64_07810 [Candidatus Zixiibacteriota bacterium]|nr:MAG: hypothetical protein JSW64_07810 [candidate division Zixibacteria bacterium]